MIEECGGVISDILSSVHHVSFSDVEVFGAHPCGDVVSKLYPNFLVGNASDGFHVLFFTFSSAFLVSLRRQYNTFKMMI